MLRFVARRGLKATLLAVSSRYAVPCVGFAPFSRAFSAQTSQEDGARAVKKQHEFKAETRKLLDIVANSLYSDKEVFCRELISNAADAMEKLRHEQVASAASFISDAPSDIKITLDSDAKTFTIQDSGIGMSEAEMIEYLGTIARSGSKQFAESGAQDSEAKKNIIGQFGVGFYSAFMVGDKVTVYSRSAKLGAAGFKWESDGLGSYEISECEDAQVGTRIVIQIKDDAMEFLDSNNIKDIVKKYSNFVGFPIVLNGEAINTIQPLWSRETSAISPGEHKQFYRFISHAWDDYNYMLHFKTDAPIQINALLYVPERNLETVGTGRLESNVSLYSRRIMIQSKTKKLLPEYLRFMSGIVESDDIPMNLSREMLQNSALISKLSDILTGKVLRWLQDEAKKDAAKYDSFFFNFGMFLKEGICMSEPKHQKELAKLLRFESSATEPGKFTSMAEYLERKKESQDKIYYLFSNSRKWAEESPYYEQFKEKGQEVLFFLDPIDEFVSERLHEFKGVKLVSIDSSDASFEEKKDSSSDGGEKPIDADGDKKLVDWFKETLGPSVLEVKLSTRNLSFPAIITDHESPTVRRLMKMVPGSASMATEMPQKLELNANHAIIQNLKVAIADGKTELAKDVTHQIFDNALIAAGILDDPRVMLKRLNRILELSMQHK